MLNDIKDSIKAKLYDFAYTPFMSSVLISWVVLNHKYLLVFFADYGLEKKLALLKGWDFALHTPWFTLPCAMNVFEPILFGLFYVFVYPKISKEFYSYTLERTKELKKIKQDVEDETPLTVKESQDIRKEIDYLTIERDEIRNRLTKTEQYYEQKYFAEISSLKAENESFKKSLEDLPTITAERDELKERFGNIKRLDLKTLTVSDAFPEANSNQNDEEVIAMTPNVEAPKALVKQEDDRTKILRYFYEGNYKTTTETTAIDQIVNFTKLARPKAKLLVDSLVAEKILSKDGNYLKITNLGNKTLVELFDKSSQSEELN
jgi:phage host-nuclease inhibitor protein Gam